MPFNRREFLQGTLAAAAAASFPTIWMRAREARALDTCEQGINFVIVQLKGGNDGLNTLIPMTDGTGQNRTVYTAKRPYLGINPSDLAATQVSNDPLHNGQLALHPHMLGLKGLFDSGNLAVLAGCHYAQPNLSHDVSERIWYRADPPLHGPGTGWVGRVLDGLCVGQPLAVPAVDTSSQLTPLFYGNTSVLAFDSLLSLSFPTLGSLSTTQKADYKARFLNIYNQAISSGGYLGKLGGSGYAAVSKINDYKTTTSTTATNLNDLINGTTLSSSGAFGVSGKTQGYGLAKSLRTILALMKGEQPGNVPLGCRIFRASIGGFDTHGDQGAHIPLGTKSIATKVNEGFANENYGALMHRLDRAVSAFWQDLKDNNLHGNTVVMAFSEFGRRIEENGNHDADSGTDHGSAGPAFVIGPKAGESTAAAHMVGGLYGAFPELNVPDSNGNMVYQLDFRQMYGELMTKWFGLGNGTVSTILNGFSYSPVGFLV